MNKTILEALTHASMIAKDEGEKLAADLAKIHALLDSAANSDIAQGNVNDGHQVERFLYSAGLNGGDNAISLRGDEVRCEKTAEKIAEQSKHHDAPYNSVPRVV